MAALTADTTDRLRLALLAGVVPADLAALPERVRRGVILARALGAPVLPAVDAAADAEDDAARVRRAVDVSTAQARTVARGLAAAPLVLAPLIGRIAGVDVVTFYRSAAGRGVLVLGLLLLLAGGSVAGLMIAHAARPSRDAALDEVAELVAVALAAGAGTASALRAVADVLPAQAERLRRLALELDLGIERPDAVGADAFGRIRDVLMTASVLGAPAVPTLRRLARDLRAAELARVLAAAERLPAQLTVPTTLMLLPATLLLVAAPLVVSGLAGVLG